MTGCGGCAGSFRRAGARRRRARPGRARARSTNFCTSARVAYSASALPMITYYGSNIQSQNFKSARISIVGKDVPRPLVWQSLSPRIPTCTRATHPVLYRTGLLLHPVPCPAQSGRSFVAAQRRPRAAAAQMSYDGIQGMRAHLRCRRYCCDRDRSRRPHPHRSQSCRRQTPPRPGSPPPH